MGADKALLEVHGRPLALTAAEALRGAGATRVVAVGGDAAGLEALGLEVVADRHPGAGPLGALVTALAALDADVVAVLACDLPAASADAVGAVVGALGDHDVAAPRRGPHLDVLHAAYHRRVEAHLAARFAAGERSVHRALADRRVAVVEGVDPRALADVDRPGDLPGA